MSKSASLIGLTFGDLTVVCRNGSDRHGALYLCRCACSKTRTAHGSKLRSGAALSCGCRRGEQHGGRRRPEYKVWGAIIERCENPHSDHFDRYGGRGIRMCRRWRESFAAFLADMGARPSPQHWIERIDNDGHYEPVNCKWATRAEQARNRSNNRLITFCGESLPLVTWAERTGLSKATIEGRLRRGWPTERALTAPLDSHRGGHLCAR